MTFLVTIKLYCGSRGNFMNLAVMIAGLLVVSALCVLKVVFLAAIVVGN